MIALTDPAAFDAALARWLGGEADRPERAPATGREPAAGEQPGELVNPSTLDRLRAELDQAALRRLIELFLDHTERRIEQLSEALAAGDLDTAKQLAHTIKGGAQPLGAARIARLCEELEGAADPDRTAALASRLREAWEATRPALERQLGRGRARRG